MKFKKKLKKKKTNLSDMNIDPEGVIILKETTFFWMSKSRYVCGKNKTRHQQIFYFIVKWYVHFARKNSCMDKLYVLRTMASKRDKQCINFWFMNSLESKF